MSSARGCRWLGGALGALLGLLLLATTMLFAQAQALIPVELGAQVSVPLGSEFEVLEDPAAQWQLDDILRAELARQFRVPGSSGSNFGYSRSAFWLHARVHLAAGAPERWLLEAANPTLEYLDVYVVTPAAGVVDAQHGAGMAKFAQRAVAHRNHVKPLQLQPGVDNELYIRVASRLNLSVPLHLWQPDALWQKDQLEYALLAAYFGVLLGLTAYNLLLYFFIRDRICLSYSAFAVAMGLIQASISGFGAQYLWPELPEFNTLVLQSARALVSFFALLLVRDYLSTARRMPGFDRVLRVMAGVWALAFVVALVWESRMFNLLGAVFSLFSLTVVIALGIQGVRRGYPEARYFLAAWAVMATGTVVFALHNLGLVPATTWTVNSFRLGSAAQMLLLAFALTDRVRIHRHNKEQAKAAMLGEQARRVAYAAARERYLAVIDHVDAGMVVQTDHAALFANQRAATITGRTHADLLADGLLASIHEEDRPRLARWRRPGPGSATARARIELRTTYAQPDGSERWIELDEGPVPWDAGQAVLTFFFDITDRKADATELQTMLARQEDLAQVRKRFVAMASHEFRTPLATIQSSADLLANYEDRLSESEITELLESIGQGVQRMARMLDRILLLSRAEAGKIANQSEPLDMAATFARWIAQASSDTDAAAREIHLEIAPEAATGRLDPKLLAEVFLNLLSNALKFSPATAPVVVRLAREGDVFQLSISDHGPGIPAAEQRHLFQPFYRCSNVGAAQGVGLGLAIVRVIVDLLGGSVSLQGRPEGGTQVQVRLPQRSRSSGRVG